MRVAFVIAAMLLCMAGCSRKEIKKGIAVKTREIVTNSIGMELIEIPAGKFRMGDGEGVAVTLTKSFGLGKTEVTQGQWKKVMGTEPWERKQFVKADKDCPATYVSWEYATEFCETLTAIERKAGKLKADEEYRLPTEAEWEYACRAGTETAYSFGNDESELGRHAWFEDNAFDAGEKYAHKVGLKKPNPWGLHDMHGNVWEWCSDWYDGKLSGGTDPVGPDGGSFRVSRGGSWGNNLGDCRSAGRYDYNPSNRGNDLGFRVARSQSATVTRPEMEKTEPVRKVFKGEIVTNSIGMELIEIPAGKFTMGSPKDKKFRHTDEAQVAVTLTKPFGLGKTEVTQGQWKSVMGTEPWKGQQLVQADKDCPATYVSWGDATEFCEKLTAIERKAGKLKADEEYRLPTEAEWEYACRAGTETAYSFGNDESELGRHAWFEDNAFDAGEKYAHKVGLKKPNPWGLHDMHGNVWEWCSDWYDGKLSGGTDPVGPDGGSFRVSRGGSWGNNLGDCRSAGRYDYNPSNRGNDLGFRVARSQSATVTRPEMEKTEPIEKNFKSGEIVTNSIGMELIEIPAGKFRMGSSEYEKGRFGKKDQVAVTLTKSFGFGKTEVTQGQWKSVMGTEPWKGKDFVQADKDCPAIYVQWNDATEFCQKLTATEHKNGKLPEAKSYRLPTEAEWEYACRAGTETAFSFGDDESKLGEYGWFNGNTSKVNEPYAHSVGLKKPNPWGLYDMHGNVFEWCSDWYDGKLLGGTDPVGPNGGSSRVNRGSGWRGYPGYYRSAYRYNDNPLSRSYDLGFRVARSQSVQ